MLIVVAIAAAIVQTPPAQDTAFDAPARIREAIETVRPVAYRAAQVDWEAVEAAMLRQAEGARDTADLLPAYQTLVAGLGDGHSFIQPPRAVMATWRERHGDKSYDPAPAPSRQLTSTLYARDQIESRDLPAGAGTVRQVVTPSFAGDARSERAETYADTLFHAVAEAPGTTCGYIVDLRGNTGGNFWPMITGLSGLLGDGPQGLFRDAKGQDSAYATLSGGRALIAEGETAGSLMAQAPGWRPLPHLVQAPVAVLVDDATASSGEGVALAFVGRPHTRSFGQSTYGVASANNGYRLSDGVNMVVTVAMMVDPQGRTHPQGYQPDVVMDPAGDAPVEAAQAWLAGLPQCAAR